MISNISGRDECFTAGELPWHKLGINVGECQTAGRALTLAGLDWDVYTREIQLPCGTVIPDRRANVRLNKEGKDHYLGVVGTRYEVLQNRDAFDFMDNIIGQGAAMYETAGAINEGRVVWMSVKLPDDIVVGKNDATKKYLLLCNSHDGSKALSVQFTPVRVVCNNTLTAALQDKGTSFSIRHTRNIKTKAEEASRVLGIARKYFDEVGAVFNKFFLQKMDEPAVEGYVKRIFPDVTPNDKIDVEKAQERIDNIRTSVMENYESGLGASLSRGTLWGAYNAVTEYVDHSRFTEKKSVDTEGRLTNIVFGGGANLKQKAFDEAVAVLA